MNKNPLGFAGGGLWAIIILLVIGVGWVENRFGTTIAGYAVIAVLGVLFLIAGALLILAAMQTFGNLLVGIKQAESKVKLHEARAMASMVSNEGKIMAKAMGMAGMIGRQIGANYKAQIKAEHQMETAGQVEEDTDPYIELRQDQYEFSEDEW